MPTPFQQPGTNRPFRVTPAKLGFFHVPSHIRGWAMGTGHWAAGGRRATHRFGDHMHCSCQNAAICHSEDKLASCHIKVSRTPRVPPPPAPARPPSQDPPSSRVDHPFLPSPRCHSQARRNNINDAKQPFYLCRLQRRTHRTRRTCRARRGVRPDRRKCFQTLICPLRVR